MGKFKEQLKAKQIQLIKEGSIFDGAKGGGLYRGNNYPHLLEAGKEQNNLFPDIRESVRDYFSHFGIPFWAGGNTVTSNTLSSQVSCLNHLFLIKNNADIAKIVLQNLVGSSVHIKEVLPVPERVIRKGSNKVIVENPKTYISFEAVSLTATNQMREGKPLRGMTRTSIDALALVRDKDNKSILLVIEWKLVENDSGNKAPSSNSSSDEFKRGGKRIDRYMSLIKDCELDNEKVFKDVPEAKDGFRNHPLFILPFYELMRQTLWANNYMSDFHATDYRHIEVLPLENPMRDKSYEIGKGVKDAWTSLLNLRATERYITADPHVVVSALQEVDRNKYGENFAELADYLNQRYYSYK